MSSFSGRRVQFSAPPPRAVISMNLDTIKVRIEEERKKAQEASDKFGAASKEAALAWDIVEELQAEASHMQANAPSKDPLEQFCEDSPEADECRVYDN